MLVAVMSACSTSSAAPSSGMKSLADELEGAFEDGELDLSNTFNLIGSSRGSHEEIVDRGRIEEVVAEEGEQPSQFQSQSNPPEVSDTDLEPTSGQPAKQSIFVEHWSPIDSCSQPLSAKEHTNLMASKNNRDLIDRNADGFFKMETNPSVTGVERCVQQSQGIAALQKTLVPPTTSNAAPSSIGSSHTSFSTAVDPVKRLSTLKQITFKFAEPRGRKSHHTKSPYPSAASRSKAAPRFSLGRDLVAAGHKKRLSEPSAPARFVRLPTDPVVVFKRNFSECGLKLSIPDPETDDSEGDDSRSIDSVPDVDSAGGFKFNIDKPKLDFGVPRGFIADQCFESSCPIRWAHAKGPYHHKGHQNSKIMTGLFGHSNPPPEIWNAYRNMVERTCEACKGKGSLPDGNLRPKEDEDLVIAFATFHYGDLSDMSGEEFHRCYRGKHTSSRVTLGSSSTKSSIRSLSSRSFSSCLGSRK